MAFTRADLQEMDKAFNKSGMAKESDADGLPENVYQAKITKAGIGRSAGGNKMQAHFEYEVVAGDPELVGQKQNSYEGLATPENMKFFRRKMKRLRKPFTSFLEVPDLLAALVGAIVEIKVVHKDDYVNTYVNKLVEEAPEGGHAEGPATGEETTTESDDASEETPTEEKSADDVTDDGSGPEEEAPSEEEPEAEEEKRSFPTQEEIAKVDEKGLDRLLKELKAKTPPKKIGNKRAVVKCLVACMEGDKDSFSQLVWNLTESALGLAKSKTVKAAEKAVIKKLS